MPPHIEAGGVDQLQFQIVYRAAAAQPKTHRELLRHRARKGAPSDHDRELRAKTIDRPSTYDNNADAVELPYDEDTWRGLCALKVAIDELHGKVKTLIGLADFRDRLKRFARGSSTPLLQEVTRG